MTIGIDRETANQATQDRKKWRDSFTDVALTEARMSGGRYRYMMMMISRQVKLILLFLISCYYAIINSYIEIDNNLIAR